MTVRVNRGAVNGAVDEKDARAALERAGALLDPEEAAVLSAIMAIPEATRARVFTAMAVAAFQVERGRRYAANRAGHRLFAYSRMLVQMQDAGVPIP